jgi:hypothetical protein
MTNAHWEGWAVSREVTQECRAYPYVSKCHADRPGCYRGWGDVRRPAVRFRRRMKRPISPPCVEEETAAPNARIAAQRVAGGPAGYRPRTEGESQAHQ